MDKFEEILDKKLNDVGIDGFYGLLSLNYKQVEPIKEAMKEYGKICFEAARKDSFINDNGWDYNDYEDFLKEFEDKKGN